MAEPIAQPASVSVAIATGQGWPDIERYVRSLEVAVHGEVVIADSSGGPPPPDGSLGPTTRWLSLRRASVFVSPEAPRFRAAIMDKRCVAR